MKSTGDSVPAIRLLNNPDGTSTFEIGRIPTLKQMNTKAFWISTTTEDWEKEVHTAPRKQYVVTLKGKIRFKVSNGSTFHIEPGIILLAEDVEGEGHSWEIEEGEKWERLYIPVEDNADDFFIHDSE